MDIKKLAAGLTAAAVFAGTFAAAPISVSLGGTGIYAAALTDGDYSYELSADGTATITGYTGAGGALSIPSTLGGKTVTAIGSRAFYMKDYITSLTVPDTVKSIGSYAFYSCRFMTTLKLSSNLTELGEYAFGFCRALGTVTVPGSVKTVGASAFYSCDVLSSVTLAKGVTLIGESAFRECGSLKTISLPTTLTSIGDTAFYNAGLPSVTVPEGTETIGSYAFGFCANLSTVSIPSTVKLIGSRAFYGCKKLSAINVASGNTTYSSYDGVLYNKKATELIWCPGAKTEVAVKSGVTVIDSYAFYDCEKLSSVTLPDSLWSIGSNAFENCTSLKSITIPKGVSSIGSCALGYYYDSGDKLISGFRIYCYSGSKAETYAKSNGIAYTIISARVPGDVDGDGDVDINDLTTLQKLLAGWSVKANTSNADVNSSGAPDIGDLTLLQKHLAGWSVKLS